MTITQTIYGLADPKSPDDIRYIGRTNDLSVRLRYHQFEPMAQDTTCKGLWVAYLWYANRSPTITPLEQKEFLDSEKLEATEWAKQAEREWINRCAETNDLLLNSEAFWRPQERKMIPGSIRKAWTETHASIIFGDWLARDVETTLHMVEKTTDFAGVQKQLKSGCQLWDCLRSKEHREHHVRARHGSIAAVESLASQFPLLAIAPVEWIAKMRWQAPDLDGYEAYYYRTPRFDLNSE
ncbi:hypothetical protein [Roseiconus lacunae]|uniref:GIY-YIG domain-containing protein n=1 Tax=Roseiconus lacunae TaxID=2605694 RepID=A0ABT7PDR7_9BACT|nr:hypothetical protein [Roseiconus lacunae]MDM4014639.1 hypothetical protein [Roseiconus lacunae]